MECGKLTAKLRDAVLVCFIEDGKEIKRYKNIEIPDEIKRLAYKDFIFDVPESGAITFKIIFEPGTLPQVWPDARTRNHRNPKPVAIVAPTPAADEEPVPATEEAPEGIVDAPESPVEPAQTENNAIEFHVVGERRKELVHAISEHLNIKARYLGMPQRKFQIGEYTVSPSGLVTGPVNPELIAALEEKGFKAE